jgi:concanavalin A-like lectin/glucanase superfamily protein
LNMFSYGITLEAWVKRNDASRSESIVCNGWQQSYCLSFAGSKVRLQTSGGASYMDSQGSVPAGVWTHVVATYDTITQKIYINGVLDSVHSYPGSVGQASNTPLGIGVDLVNDFNQNYFSGRIDNVRVWDYARSAQQIRAAMFQASGG